VTSLNDYTCLKCPASLICLSNMFYEVLTQCKKCRSYILLLDYRAVGDQTYTRYGIDLIGINCSKRPIVQARESGDYCEICQRRENRKRCTKKAGS